MMSMDEILSAVRDNEKFTPDSIYACQEYVKLYGSPQVTADRPQVVFN